MLLFVKRCVFVMGLFRNPKSFDSRQTEVLGHDLLLLAMDTGSSRVSL